MRSRERGNLKEPIALDTSRERFYLPQILPRSQFPAHILLGMKITTPALVLPLALLAGTVGVSAQHQVNVAIDPRSSGETEAELLSPGFRSSCPSVSIVRDESKAEYVVLASQASGGFFLHYYITVYAGQGKVVFSTDKHLAKNAVKAFCQFMNGQK